MHFKDVQVEEDGHIQRQKDLVHWTFDDLNVHQIHEMYEGMDSESSPCSGFVTIDEKGTVCGISTMRKFQGNNRIESQCEFMGCSDGNEMFLKW